MRENEEEPAQYFQRVHKMGRLIASKNESAYMSLLDCGAVISMDDYIKLITKQQEETTLLMGGEIAGRYLKKQPPKEEKLEGLTGEKELLIGFLTSLEKEGGSDFTSKEWIVDNYLQQPEATEEEDPFNCAERNAGYTKCRSQCLGCAGC